MKLIILVSLTLILGACATSQKSIDAHSIQQAEKLQNHNRKLKSWVMHAQVSLDAEVEYYSFNALWEQQNKDYTLQFDAFLSPAIMQLKGTASRVELRLEDKIYQGKNPEQLIAQLTPFKIPVIGLKYWIRGIKQPFVKAKQTINSAGEIQTITQSGWFIEYLDWQHFNINGQQYLLPSDISLSRKNLTIRIQPSSWSRKKQTINPFFSDLE